MTRAGRRITVDVVVDGDGLVGHAGSRDARPVSDKTGHADGGDCLTVLGAVRDQAVLCHADV